MIMAVPLTSRDAPSQAVLPPGPSAAGGAAAAAAPLRRPAVGALRQGTARGGVEP